MSGALALVSMRSLVTSAVSAVSSWAATPDSPGLPTRRMAFTTDDVMSLTAAASVVTAPSSGITPATVPSVVVRSRVSAGVISGGAESAGVAVARWLAWENWVGRTANHSDPTTSFKEGVGNGLTFPSAPSPIQFNTSLTTLLKPTDAAPSLTVPVGTATADACAVATTAALNAALGAA